MTKFCVDCRWYRATKLTDQCWHPDAATPLRRNIVTGEGRRSFSYGYCDPCRMEYGHCKFEAIHWEPRANLTLIERIKRSIEA